MKLRRTFRFHRLVRPRIRQTWNKYNLFNMHRNFAMPRFLWKTFFQQKWTAKAITRGYHGEHIKERKWERMFSRRLASVVDMDPRYMARFDGAEQAAGRGSGRQLPPGQDELRIPGDLRQPWERGTNLKTRLATPYMQMTFAPMERRLDVAIFRAMFASSARQARQFVVHGGVTVNGKKMIYPGYLLNPGDLFQVDVERVLFATGAKKSTQPKMERKEAEEVMSTEDDANADAANADVAHENHTLSKRERALQNLPRLTTRAKALLADAHDQLTLRKRKELRNFVLEARRWLTQAGVDVGPEDNVAMQEARAAHAARARGSLKQLLTTGSIPTLPPPPSSKILDKLADLAAATPLAVDASASTELATSPSSLPSFSEDERHLFYKMVDYDARNPKDPSKPYATPWRPRPFMNAFASIPRYLEVNPNICAAVYLRHPVARPGQAEIPTPFPLEVNQLAFNWYLRRR